MSKTTQKYAKRKHYDQSTGELVDTYPDGMNAQQYYNRNKPHAPKTLGEALTLIRNLRIHNKRLLTRIKHLEYTISQQDNGHMPPEKTELTL